MKLKFTMTAVISLAASVFPLMLVAQSQTIDYSKGQVLEDALSDTVAFALPEFVDGKIFFEDFSSSSARLNISNIDQCVKFIDASGDTLSLVKENEVRYVVAANKTFYKTQFGYAQVLRFEGDCSFCFVKDVIVEQLQAMTSYGRLPATSTAKTVNALPDMGGTMNTSNVGKYMELEYDMTVRPVLVKGNKIMLSSKKNFMKVFPEKKDLIKRLADEMKTDFSDVRSAYEFFNAITAK